MFSVIWQKLKEMIQNMIGARTIEQTLHVAPAISSQMENAIELWDDMYKDKAPWLHEPSAADPTRVVSLGLPALIASEKARMVVLEMESEITVPTEEQEQPNPKYEPPQPDMFGNILPSTEPETIIEDVPTGPSERAEYLNEQYQKLKDNLRTQLEYGVAKGGLVIKPYVIINNNDDTETTATIEFDYIQADNFYPLAYNASKEITEAAFIQTKIEKDTVYRRLEYHKWEGNRVQVVNKVFKSTDNTHDGDMLGVDLGQEVPLSTVPEWSVLKDRVTINDVTRPLFAYFKMPEANTIDTSSPLGVSGYSRAVSLIKDADIQYSRLLWEYEGGEMAIDIDRDAISYDEKLGRSVRPMLQERLFRKIDISQTGETYFPYAPSLRDTSYIQGLNTILMRIEDTVGLSRGTLSDAAAEARTATELKILKQRSYSTNAEIQKALEATLKHVIYIMDVYATLYEITPEGEYDVSFEWDDSILVDVDVELNKRLAMLQQGLTSKLETRMWYFGETERQAAEALAQIDKETMQNMQENLAMEANANRLNNMENE